MRARRSAMVSATVMTVSASYYNCGTDRSDEMAATLAVAREDVFGQRHQRIAFRRRRQQREVLLGEPAIVLGLAQGGGGGLMLAQHVLQLGPLLAGDGVIRHDLLDQRAR